MRNHGMREQRTTRDAARWARRRLGLCLERAVAGRSRRVGTNRRGRLRCASLREQLGGFRPLTDPGDSVLLRFGVGNKHSQRRTKIL